MDQLTHDERARVREYAKTMVHTSGPLSGKPNVKAVSEKIGRSRHAVKDVLKRQ